MYYFIIGAEIGFKQIKFLSYISDISKINPFILSLVSMGISILNYQYINDSELYALSEPPHPYTKSSGIIFEYKTRSQKMVRLSMQLFFKRVDNRSLVNPHQCRDLTSSPDKAGKQLLRPQSFEESSLCYHLSASKIQIVLN